MSQRRARQSRRPTTTGATRRRDRGRWAIIAASAVVVLLLIGALIHVLAQRGGDPGSALAVRPDSYVLDDGGPDAVTVVEFLDFECPGCGAFYPVVEDLRSEYAGRITYVVRQLPLDMHPNALPAALAAEAAAQQGRFEDMYHLLYQTQEQWRGAQQSQAPLFREYAEQLGLDLDAYDAAVADPATLARVQEDIDDARALGITGTPTFVVDGEIVRPASYGDLEAAVVAALGGGSPGQGP